jgi:hypothetical protein
MRSPSSFPDLFRTGYRTQGIPCNLEWKPTVVMRTCRRAVACGGLAPRKVSTLGQPAGVRWVVGKVMLWGRGCPSSHDVKPTLTIPRQGACRREEGAVTAYLKPYTDLTRSDTVHPQHSRVKPDEKHRRAWYCRALDTTHCLCGTREVVQSSGSRPPQPRLRC